MSTASALQLVPVGSSAPRGVAKVVDATGTPEFGTALLEHLHSACGADYCAVFRVGSDAPTELVTCSRDGSPTAHTRVASYLGQRYWSQDPAMQYAKTKLAGPLPMLMRIDVARVPDPVVRETIWPRIRDRVVIAGRGRDGTYSMSILREGRGKFSPIEIERIGANADVLISLFAKHSQLARSKPPGVSDVITSLPDIRRCLAGSSPLSAREADVCARILYGMTTSGIALDLGISDETVKTFRKLAYRRLRIGSERELLQWYLALWERFTRD